MSAEDVGGLPELAVAALDPRSAAQRLAELVRESLQEDWRRENSHAAVLERLADLIVLHLDALDGDAGACDHEAAACNCLKLARNLCAGQPRVQEHWRRRGVVEKLAPRLRADMARPEERGGPWCDAVASFLAQVVAGNPEMRVHAMLTLFPYGLAAALSLCWQRPHRAFLLAQNLFASEAEGPSEASGQLLETPEGHCVLFLLLSLLRGEGVSEGGAGDAQAREWATIFFYGLWRRGGFPAAYRGVRRLSAERVQAFLCQAAAPAPPEGTAVALSRVAPRLCGQADAVGLLWHTVHGVLGEAEEGRRLALALLQEDFAALLAEEMAEACVDVAAAWGLDFRAAPSPEALAALGVEASMVVTADLAARAVEARGGPAPGDGDAAEAVASVWGRGEGPFAELTQAALELSAVRGAAGAFPLPLAGALLTSNIALIEALHRLRFGDVSSSVAKRELAQEAVAAAQACQLVDQVRLCGNLLYGLPAAQNFARLTNGLRVLLSHCYADHDLPMLREVGIFAVRNATHTNVASQEVVRELLAERRAVDERERQAQAAPPSIEEFGFGV